MHDLRPEDVRLIEHRRSTPPAWAFETSSVVMRWARIHAAFGEVLERGDRAARLVLAAPERPAFRPFRRMHDLPLGGGEAAVRHVHVSAKGPRSLHRQPQLRFSAKSWRISLMIMVFVPGAATLRSS